MIEDISHHLTHKGFTLVEVLISMLVLSVGIFGLMIGVTDTAKKITSQSDINFAMQVSNNFISRMKINFSAENKSEYLKLSENYAPTFVDCAALSCNSKQMASQDLRNIVIEVTSRLYQPKLKLVENNNMLHFSLAWKSFDQTYQHADCAFQLAADESCIVLRQIDL